MYKLLTIIFLLGSTVYANTPTFTVGTDPLLNIQNTGTALNLNDDAVSPMQNLGFDFTYYGNTYSQARVAMNGFVTFNIGSKLINKILEEVYRQDLDRPPKNRLRKIVFKDGIGLSTKQKLSIVGTIIGKSKIKKDDIYEAMLYIHEEGKITIKKLSQALKCAERTIYRNMCDELKEEKYLLNKQL